MKHIFLVLAALISLQLKAQDAISTDQLIPKESIGVHNRNFKLGGFYYRQKSNVNSVNDTVNYIAPLIFFKNGTVKPFDYIGNTSSTLRIKGKGKKCILKPREDFETIITFFKCFAEVVKLKEIYSVYSIEGDRIRIQSFGAHFFVENRGKVLNDSTFVITKSINYGTKKVVDKNYTYQFHVSKKPDSTKFKPSSVIQKYYLKQSND
ncbi:hypothetical protein KO504_02575 [Winogradskyella psychrotolerans]|uniref:hypothetical protein n=1 Tax=Winogradskyella psychrotolerans TaxID=1344585 RepID=UPI001C06B113|nr:hypothetical protein [Winogradskyella psychrotolerans]MBU2920210.1 hypothetical protein [Winogradskyella psychrotolerans]